MSTDSINQQFNIRKYTMIIALILIWMLFGALSWIIIGDPVFLYPRNVSNLFRQMTITGFLACGMLMVIVTGGIDLSVGSVTGFISALVAFLQADKFPDLLMKLMPAASIEARAMVSTVAAIGIALFVGILVGAFQGSIIAYLGVPAFVVTLGGMLIFRGGVLGITGGQTKVPIEEPLRIIAQEYIGNGLGYIIAAIVILLIFLGTLYNRKKKKDYGFVLPSMAVDIGKAAGASAIVLLFTFYMNNYRGIPIPVLILGVFAFIMHYITKNTRFGRYVYALGGNREATRLSGINIRANQFKVHILMGFFGGLAGIILTGYVAAGTPGGGVNYELDAIASCVIGGTSLAGGSGTILGSIVGALVMASLANGMSVINIPVFWQYIIKGLVLIIAVYFDISSKKKNS